MMPRSLFFLIFGTSMVAMILFAYMRHRQAQRNDKRRERLERMQEEMEAVMKRVRERDSK